MPSDSVSSFHHLRGRVALLMATDQNLEAELRRLKKVTGKMEYIEVGSVSRRTTIVNLQAVGHDDRA
eukprot:4168156-Pyramimonas_sp.AAC.1